MVLLRIVCWGGGRSEEGSLMDVIRLDTAKVKVRSGAGAGAGARWGRLDLGTVIIYEKGGGFGREFCMIECHEYTI